MVDKVKTPDGIVETEDAEDPEFIKQLVAELTGEDADELSVEFVDE